LLYLIIALGVMAVMAGWWMFRRNRSRKAGSSEIDMVCRSEAGSFTVKGNRRYFTVRKNGNFEFLVRDGQIVAVRDLRRSSEYVFYGGAG